MKQYIDKSAVVAEIDRIQNTTMDKNRNFTSSYDEGKFDALTLLENYIDTLEVKEDKGNGFGNITQEEYWLFTINFDNAIFNCFFDFFPSKKDLKKVSKGKEYAITNTLQLTKEQFNKLTKDE